MFQNPSFHKHHAILLPLAVMAFLVAVWSVIVAFFATDIPWIDQWTTPIIPMEKFENGTLAFADFFKQHNEGRKIIPTAISLGFYRMVGYFSPTVEIVFGLVLCGVLALLMQRLLRRTGFTVHESLLLAAFYASLLLSAHTIPYHLFSITFERLIPEIALIASLLIWLHQGITIKNTLLVALLYVIAQYSYPSGLVLWGCGFAFLILYPLITRKNITPGSPYPVASLCVLIGIAALSCYLYFLGYKTPKFHPSPSAIFDQSPISILHFMLVFLGNGFSDHPVAAPMLGGLFLLLFGTLSIRFLISHTTDSNPPALLGWVALGCYSIGLAALITITRLPMHFNHAFRVDYVVHPLFMIVASVLLLLRYAPHPLVRKTVFTAISLVMIAQCVLLISPGLLHHLPKNHQGAMVAKACMHFSAQLERTDCLIRLHPIIKYVRKRIASAVEHGVLAPFPTPHLLEESAGSVSVSYRATYSIFFHGNVKVKDRAADAVLVYDGKFASENSTLITIAEVTRAGNPDFIRLLRPTDNAGNFGVEVLALPDKPPCDFHFYAYDTNSGELRVIPLAGC